MYYAGRSKNLLIDSKKRFKHVKHNFSVHYWSTSNIIILPGGTGLIITEATIDILILFCYYEQTKIHQKKHN